MNRPSRVVRYGVPVLAVAAAMLLRWPLWDVLHGELAFLFLWPVVLFCAWYGGLGAGLLATVLAATAAAYFLLEPRPSLAVARPADLVGLAAFVLVSGTVSMLCGRLHQTRRAAERQGDWLRVSLESIGDAVIATDTEGRVMFLNPAAQALTGWGQQEARGRPLEEVFPIISEKTRQVVEDPVAGVIRENAVVRLAEHTALVARDGAERPIQGSAAPIRANDGRVFGVILVFHDVTERRRAEDRLREEAKLLDLANVLARDLDDRITLWNAGAERLYGWSRAEAVGRVSHELLRTRFPEPMEEVRSRLLRDGRWEGELTHTRRDGEPVVVASQWVLHRDGEGRPAAILEVNTDITPLKRAAKVLEERTADLAVAKAHLEAVFHSVGEGIAVFDPDANLVFCNDAEARIAGFSSPREMMRGLSYFAEVFELTDAEGRPVPVEQWPVSRVLRGEAFAEWECHGRRTDTGRVWDFNFSGSPVRDEAGRQVLAVVVTRDVTDRKRAERALRESEERFRTLADSIPQLAWAARPDGFIHWYNRRWYEYTGTTPEQMAGWGWQSVHDPKVLPKVLERWRASLATGEPFDMVLPLRGRDGVFRPFLTRVVPLRGDDGRILQWFGTNTDVSEIEEMRAKLEEADRRKNQFVMMLAHELRNPLAPLRNGLQLLQASGADRQTVEQARAMMARQVGHLARIIEDLLDVSRLMRGRVELRPERLDLGRLARTVLDDQRPAFDRAGLAVDADLPELPVWVEGDPTRLTQVLDNLLQNAVKFTDPGGTVTVRVRADAGRRQAVLTVRDTGAGIEPDLLPHLFEPFAQADQSLDRSKGGLGLGLSLVRGLVELHGGAVHAASDGPGRGAEFAVRLPMQPEPAAITRMPEAPRRAGGGLRILVVEDNRDAADSLMMLLTLFGNDVTVAYTGPSGVEAAKAYQPDVVLCDIGLPGLDGFGVARELRRHPATAKARLVAVTGYGSDEDRLRTREAGFDAHLTKPADPNKLQELLTAW